MSADIPHGLPGARSAARAFPCKRCTPRKVSSLFPWVSSCSTRWNQASPAPPSSPAGFTLRLRRILLAVMAKLPGTCERAGVRSVARIRVRMNLYVCVCVCVCMCLAWRYVCVYAQKRRSLGKMAICRRKIGSGSRWWSTFFGKRTFIGCFYSLCLCFIRDYGQLWLEVVCLKSCATEWKL